MALATLTVDLNASIAKFEQDLQEAVRNSKQATNQIKDAFQGLRELLITFGVGIGLKEFFTQAIAANIEYERSVNQLGATLKATGYAAGLTKDELEELTQTLSRTTAFDDDDIRKAEVTLLRFRNIQGDTFKQAIKLTLDYAAAQRSTAAEAASTIGKAFDAPMLSIKALAAVGVQLTQTEKDLVKNLTEAGNAMGAQAVMAAALERSLGGQAAGENTGLYGATRSVTKAWGDLLKQLGQSGGSERTATVIDAVTTALRELGEDIDQFKGADTLQKKITAIIHALTLDPVARDRFSIPDVVEPTTAAERQAATTERERAERGRRAQDRIREEEAARLKQYQALQTRIAQAQAASQREVQIEQQSASARTAIVELFYSRGELSATDYYAQLTDIAWTAAEQQIASIQKVINAQRELLRAPQTSSEQKPAIVGQIEGLVAQQEQIRTQLANTARMNTEKLTDAEQSYRDAVGQTTIALLEQQGRYVEAAQRRIEIEDRIYTLQLRARGDDSALRELEARQALTISQARLNELFSQYATLRAQDETRELGAQTRLAQAGASPQAQLRALAEINASRLASLPALRAVVAELEREARVLNDQAGIANAQRLAAELDNVEANARGAAAAADEFHIALQRGALLFRQEAIAEERVQNLRISGATSALGMQYRLDQVRTDSIAALQAEADALDAIARRTQDPRTIQAVDEMRVAIERLKAEAQSTANVFRFTFEEAFSDAFVEFINGTKSASDAFESFAQDVIRSLERIAAMEVAKAIFGLGGPGGGIGDILARIFGRTTAGPPVSLAAEGGIFTRPTLIAERGQPEAAVPLSGGRFIPVKFTDAGAARGSVSVVVNVNSGGQMAARGNSTDGEQFGKVIAGLVHERIVQEQRPGGLLARGR